MIRNSTSDLFRRIYLISKLLSRLFYCNEIRDYLTVRGFCLFSTCTTTFAWLLACVWVEVTWIKPFLYNIKQKSNKEKERDGDKKTPPIDQPSNFMYLLAYMYVCVYRSDSVSHWRRMCVYVLTDAEEWFVRGLQSLCRTAGGALVNSSFLPASVKSNV